MTADATELLVATDLDGCLLDEETYSYDEAREALNALSVLRIPLILVSSKTRAEMVPLHRTLGLDAPLVVENGGAILIPEGCFPQPPVRATLDAPYWTVVLGTPRVTLLAELKAIASETGAELRSFAALGRDEVAARTGLSYEAAGLALAREFDEPFLLDDEDQALAIVQAARDRGLAVTRGGRFWHLTGRTDKGHALRVLLSLLDEYGRRFSTVGLGDSPNDLELLRAVQRPIIVPRPGGSPDPSLSSALPVAEVAPAPGPRGWNAAVLAVLRGERKSS
jgi:mannosyl-3-phosphoglycerate phosphatase